MEEYLVDFTSFHQNWQKHCITTPLKNFDDFSSITTNTKERFVVLIKDGNLFGTPFVIKGDQQRS